MLRRFVEWLFPVRCPHMWEEERRMNILRGKNEDQIGVASFCRCNKCGERRVFRMMAF